MKISLNWIQEFTDIKCSVNELVAKIGAQLGEVEEVVDLGERYNDVVVAKVISCEKHPNADKLSVCLIDDGGKVKSVKRNANGLVQVVCGAPNVRKNLTVAWLPPGAIVPSTFDKEQFKLEAREIRGQVSNGMLASGSELAISDDHSGILVLDKKASPGDSFADIYKLNDHIVEIENNMFTHRPDCFGILGVAREIAGIQRINFNSPEWYLKELDAFRQTGDTLLLSVKTEAPDVVPRFMAVPMSGVTVGKSPIMFQSFLSRVGVKPINNIVDITNFVMVLTGQPMHAYDYDKVAAKSTQTPTLIARKAKKGETLTLLGGKQVKFEDESIVIATDKEAVGIGGVMGGQDTEVDTDTKNIILECANFDMYSIRRTSMKCGLFTDAVTRFNKGQSPLQNENILAYAIAFVKKMANGHVAGEVHDVKHLKGYAKTNGFAVHPPVTVTPEFVNERLGTDLSVAEITKLLENVEFIVEPKKDGLEVTAPFWRTDIEIPEDIVEEVGRLYGYDHLPLVLPKRDLTPAQKNPMLELKSKIRQVLSAAGANEVLTYSFVHGDLIEKVGQDKEQAFELNNALSPDLQYYRLSLTPSLLDKVNSNLRADYVRTDDNEFALFELNKAHNKQEKNAEGLPKELESLAFVFAADDKTAQRKYAGAPYYMARKYLSSLLIDLGRSVPNLVPLEGYSKKIPVFAPFEPKRSAVIEIDGKALGVVGEYKNSVKKALKLPKFSAGFEMGISYLADALPDAYLPVSKYPRTQQDISFKVQKTTTYTELFDLVWDKLLAAKSEHGYDPTLGAVDIYQPKKGDKHITLRVWLTHPDRTLTTEEVNKLLGEVAKTAKTKLQATRI